MFAGSDLSGIPYPVLPVVLPSASDLFKPDLFNILPTGYISPRAMVTQGQAQGDGCIFSRIA